MKTLKAITEFTVKRSEWYRGQDSQLSFLLRNDGAKCCVGFCCLAMGATKKAILRHRTALDVADSKVAFPQLSNSEVMSKIYLVNDSDTIKDPAREKRLTRLFKRLGITIHFED